MLWLLVCPSFRQITGVNLIINYFKILFLTVKIRISVQIFRNIDKNEPFPDYKSCMPKIREACIQFDENALEINENRKTLFANKTFVFTNNSQMSDYEEIIKLAGGTCILAKSSFDRKTFLQPNYICIQRKQDSQLSQNSQRVLSDLNCK